MSERPIYDVNIEFGDDVSRMLYKAAKQSWANRPGAVVEMHPSFSGWRAIRPDYKPVDCYEGMGSDGIGTKVEIAERVADHSTAPYDLFAMTCDDVGVRGAEPIAINTVLDVNQLLEDDEMTEQAVTEMARGYIEAAASAGVVILNGETAELGQRVKGYGPFNYNWSATVLWYAHKDRVLTGHQIKPGDSLVGIREYGFRSNGITDVRKAMLEHYGPNWHNELIPELGTLALGHLVKVPSTIFTRMVNELTGGYDITREPAAKITGIAHITGGGQPSKLGRMLQPTGYGALIDNPIEPPDIMKHVQALRGLSDRAAYGKWHMGAGMVIATPEPEKVAQTATDWWMSARTIGVVTEEPGLRIKNCGVQQSEEWLSF